MPSVRGLRALLEGLSADLASGRRAQVAGVSESLAELVTLGLLGGPARKVVVVLPTAKDLSSWTHFVAHARVRASTLPYFASWGNDRFINPALARRQRIFGLASLAALQPSDPPAVVVTTLQALGQRSLAPEAFRQAAISLRTGAEQDQDDLLARLDDLGYTPSVAVEEEGSFAVRGGIVDVYAPSEPDPVRIEFLGDAVVSLRTFAVADQKSRATLESFLILPASEAVTPAATRKEDAQRLFEAMLDQGVNPADRDGMLAAFQKGVRFSGFDMFAPLFRPASAPALAYVSRSDAALLFPAGIERCLEQYDALHEAFTANYKGDVERHRPSMPPDAHFLPPAELREALAAHRRVVEFGNPYATASANLYRVEARLTVEGAPLVSDLAGAELFDRWLLVFDEVMKRRGGTIGVLAHTPEQIDRIVNLLRHRGHDPVVTDTPLASAAATLRLASGRVHVGPGDLTSHLWLDDEELLLVPEQSLFGARPRKPKPSSQKLQNYLSSFADLKVGDLVVHVQHGIGRYRGLTGLTVAGSTSDFLVIEYAGGDKIYLPVDRLGLLQRYAAGADGAATQTVDKLGGPGPTPWDRRKSKVAGAVRDMAEQLLKIQARRAVARGHAFVAADDTYLKFEAAFPYEETEDQLRALQDVEADLRSGKPMDRLVCGDVGFGKTEIALRAAMRTVLEGFQVLVLVPTTVLCYQHYRTFKARLEPFGVRVAQVNRFVKGDAMRAATEGLKDGRVDVLIGTHRILSKDIKPKRLGLLVVDEEQRFGVSHKELLKELRAGAHVLTLTATPIPRTLHMAMVGLRDISIIATPPQDRISVKTYIARFEEPLIKDAIEQEVRRGGQVFFVHNRVDGIEEMRAWLKSLVPHLEVRVGHGQMREQQLESVIVDFLEQKFPVLLCTTIIESGIDMPNVNTLIVDRADRYGLAQLYQLRGRVGRSNLQAYAYFLTPAKERLSEDGMKRLDVLAAYQELGAGFQIASHDLEMRGAGNLLGGEQSGHAAAVGLELYTELLEQAIGEIRGEPVAEKVDAEIKLPVSAFIPPTYVPGEQQRLHLYKRLFAAESTGDLAALRQEAQDRFGKPPPECALLFKVARLKQLLRAAGVVRLTAAKGLFEARFAALSAKQIDHLIGMAAKQPGRYKLSPDYRLLLPYDLPSAPTHADQDAMLTELIALFDPLVSAA